MAYPVMIAGVAILVFPPGQITNLVWKGDVASFLWQKAGAFGAVAAGLFALMFLMRMRRGKLLGPFIEQLIGAVPMLGGARRELALARLAAALGALLNAGVTVIEAWGLAVESINSARLQRTVRSWKPQLECGATPAELMRGDRVFPDVFANLYATGEASGRLDDSLRKLYEYYQEEGSRRLRAFAQWLPRLIYFLILIGVAYYVISFWMGYFSNISNVL